MTEHIYAHEHPAAKPPVRISGPVEGGRVSDLSASRTGGGGLGEPGGSPRGDEVAGNREVPPTVGEEQR
jgi:hypothetical protein